jgi:hypothetical protein
MRCTECGAVDGVLATVANNVCGECLARQGHRLIQARAKAVTTIRGRAYWIDRAGPVAKLLRGDVCPGVVVELVDGRAFALYDDASPTPYANLAELVADHCCPSLAPAILRVAITGSISVRTRVRVDMLSQIYAAYTRRPDYTELKSWNVFHG